MKTAEISTFWIRTKTNYGEDCAKLITTFIYAGDIREVTTFLN